MQHRRAIDPSKALRRLELVVDAHVAGARVEAPREALVKLREWSVDETEEWWTLR